MILVGLWRRRFPRCLLLRALILGAVSIEQAPGGVQESLVAAFPAALEVDVRAVLALMPHEQYPPVGWFTVVVRGENVTIPARLYNPEPTRSAEAGLSPTQAAILGCLYSRHHDGFVRQRRIEQVIAVAEPWVVPFVVQLVGEYVLEILVAIQRGLPDLAVAGSVQQVLYGGFLEANPGFFARVERRVVSYWSCYWRSLYAEFWAYPGSDLLEMLRSAAELTTGRSCPRYAPPGNARVHGYS